MIIAALVLSLLSLLVSVGSLIVLWVVKVEMDTIEWRLQSVAEFEDLTTEMFEEQEKELQRLSGEVSQL